MPVATKTDSTKLRPVPRAESIEQPAPRLFSDSIEDPAPDEHGGGRPTSVESTASSNTTTAGYAAVAQLANFMAPMRASGTLGTREEIQAELDGIALAVRAFPLKQPDQVLREVAAYSARLTELAVLLHRSEDYSREYTRVRTMQVQKWQEQLELQWKIASRLIEVQRQDLELLK